MDPLVGAVIDRRYRIEFRLAAGGFGAIYRAAHVINGRHVALKILHPALATQADVVARFRREAKTLAQLRSPHTVKVIELGECSGVMYIAMELLQGESLFERFRGLGPLPWRRMLAITKQVCSALAEAHSLGIIHRDLKPTNIHLEEVGGDPDFVKVLDFGIAKILHGSETLDASDLTRAGQVVGTFDYMAPEQMFGGHSSVQSDIFTLGIVMYEMMSGERPFGDPDTPSDMLKALLAITPPPVSTFVDVPPDVDALVARCLARELRSRIATIDELADEIDRLLVASDDDIDDTNTVLSPAPELSPEDSLTWIDDAPATPPVKPPRTTLPGVGAPKKP